MLPRPLRQTDVSFEGTNTRSRVRLKSRPTPTMVSDLALTLKPRQCAVCRSRARLQRCGGCKVVFYCSREHQARHRRSHKEACTNVREALANLSDEEHKLRTGQQGGDFTHAELFGDWAGRWGAIPETRDYMRARWAVAHTTIAEFETADAVRASLGHLTDLLRLCYNDETGARWMVPALYLRLGRDQECYDFLKRWVDVGYGGDRVWEGMDEPRVEVRDTDVLESPEGMWTGRCITLCHAACVALIKVRMLLDLRNMQNANRAFHGAIPQEIIDAIRVRALVSSVVASRRDIVLAPIERTAELVRLVKSQIRMLFDAISEYNPCFWPKLVNRTFAVRPLEHRPRSEEEADIMAMYNYGAWSETPGSIEVIRSIMKMA